MEFLQGNTVINTHTSGGPGSYDYTWENVPAGSYSFTVRVTDAQNVTVTSAPVTVTVGGAGQQAQLYYVHPDHLNSPRAITNTAHQVVWRWDNTDPFGNNAPNETPTAGQGTFVYNLRFPGQYFDRETNLHYYYFRDYGPAIGRYVQSDPIGLRGGINTFSYVRGNPLQYSDPLGLGPWDKLYGLPKDFWKWLHAEDGGKLIKDLKDPLTGQVPKDVAKEWAEIWKKEQGGFVNPDILEWLVPWYLYSPSTGGCDASGNCSDMLPRPPKPKLTCP